MKSLNRKKSIGLCFLLIALVVFSSPATAATQAEIDAAIKAGIGWLVAQQNGDGSWASWVDGGEYQSSVSPTAFAVIKLGEYARELGYDSPFDPNYSHHEAIERGFEYIFQNAHVVDINSQPAGDPDSDGDGNGVHFGDSRYYWEETYNTSIVMMAIATTRSPTRYVAVLNSPVDGWTYKEVLDDVVDYMVFGQTDDPPGQGGWGYYPNGGDWEGEWPPPEPNTTYSDNSNTGFAVLGLAYAESAAYGFNCVIPQFVRDELNIWIDYIQTEGVPFDGGSGYEGPGGWVNALKTGNLIFEMAFYGDGPGVPRMQRALDYLARIWNHPTGDPGWRGPPPQYQAMYCIMKGLEYRGIEGILTYPVAQNVFCDVDMFEINGLGTEPVDIEVISGDLDTFLGLFDSDGYLVATDDDGGLDELSRLGGVTPEDGAVCFAITGEDDDLFRGWHEETGPYQVAVWPSGNPAPNEPEVDESESNNEFISRNVFTGTGQLVINGAIGDPEYSPPEGEPVVIDWYDDLADVIVATQNPNGSCPNDVWGASGDSVLTTAWALLTLEKATPPVAMIYGQCVLAGEPFEPTSLDDGIDPSNPGTPPYTWTVMGNVNLSVDIDVNNVMTVTYPEGWTGSETLTLICVDAFSLTYIIPYPHPTYAVCAQPVVLNVPDQMYPFDPFDLDDYLDPDCGLEPNEVKWSVSGVSEGWSVEIDPNNVVTVTAPEGASKPTTVIFTVTSTVCICAEPSDSDGATFITITGNESCFGVNRVKVGAKDERCKGIELLEVTSMAGGEQLVGIYLPEEGKDKLKANTVVDDGVNGPVTIHTSCSQPLEVGDTFGAYTVTDLVKIFDDAHDSRGDKVELKGTFGPALPIDLAVDDVTYTLKDFEGHTIVFFIPAGSFEPEGKPDKQKFKFHSPKGSEPDIKAKFDFDKCKFELKAKGVPNTNEITGTNLLITLQAGENVGEEIVEMEDKHNHLEHKKHPKLECCPKCKGIALMQVTSDQGVLVFEPEPGKEKLKANTVVDDGVNGPVTIHTSGSQSLEVGDVFGPYTISELVRIFE